MNIRRWKRITLAQLALVGGALLIVTLNASGQQPVTQQAPARQPRDYRPGDIQLDRSRVYIFVDKTGLGHVHGVVGALKEGRLNFSDANDPGRIVFDMASFVADPDDARKYLGLEGTVAASTQREVTENMLGDDVLDVRRHPTAMLEVTAIQSTGQKTKQGAPLYRIDGRFTLHGETRPIAVLAQAESQGDWLHVRGSFAMLQSDYGITPLTKAFGAIGVKDELKVWADFWVAAQPTRQ